MAIEKLIVLDDDLIIRKTLEEQLRKRRFSVRSASTLADVRRLMAEDSYDLVFADVHLPDGNGIELLDELAVYPNAPMVVMITGYGTIESAVECMRKGAFDYLIKPFAIDEIEVIIKKSASYNRLVKVNQFLNNEQNDKFELIGRSPRMKRLKTMVKKVAATEATVLITGENGTGKELVARELFRHSPRSGQPYIRVNCAAISEHLIESEFFGHEKGAFTGATQRRDGRFELAHQGTILLDEIGEISPSVQVKLLRVLQEREFERVGGNKTIQVDVRVLATTNVDLLAAVEKGTFREDLYYRLNVFPIEVPALRERPEDIPALAENFLRRFSKQHRLKIPGFTPEAMDTLVNHSWPGNVRELQNTIERAVILADDGEPLPPAYLGLMLKKKPTNVVGKAGEKPAREVVDEPEVEPEALAVAEESPETKVNGEEIPTPSRSGDPGHADPSGALKDLETIEKEHILAALNQAGGNRTRTAEILKVNIRTLRNKLRKYADEGEDILAD